MESWEFEALDAGGSRVKGRIRAVSEQDALAQIMAKNIAPLYVRKLTTEQGLFNRISASEIEQATTELSLLLRNGVQLDRALDMMSDATPNPALADILNTLTENVRGGSPLNKAFAKFGRYFNTLYCEMVRIGEESGQLATTLQRLGQNLKFQNELKNKVTQAMVYPGFILAVCVVSLYAIFNFIVPSMEGLFSNMKDIPSYTAFLLDSSLWMRENQLLLLITILMLIVLLVTSWKKPWFQMALMGFLRKLPVLKTGLLLSERIRFISSMQLMLQSGLPLAQALGFSVGVATDDKIKAQLRRVQSEVSQGRMLSDALSATDILEPVMLSLIKVGEEGGNLDVVFGELNERSRWRFEQWALRLTAMLEPLLIIIMGGLVGSVVVTMLLSIVSTSDVPL